MSSSHALFDLPGMSGAMLGMGALVAAAGLTLAFDYRGFTSWHVRSLFRMAARADDARTKMPPRKPIFRRPLEDRQRRQLLLERVIGAVFAVSGSAVALVGFVGLVGWLVT